jgi:glutaminyl-tRNA synthetase
MSSATTSWRTRRRSSSAWRRGARCGCATAISSPAGRRSRTPPGEVVELRCTYDPETRGGSAPDGRKVKATLHWVSAAQSLVAEARLYGHLFREVEAEDVDLADRLNPESLEIVKDCRIEAALDGLEPGTPVQFERLGYFSVDPDSRPGRPVFNRIVGLRDEWAKMQAKGGGA